MSDNTAIINDAIEAFWRWLELDGRFGALGLRQFRMTDGNILPVDAEGGIAASDLPAIYVEEIGVTLSTVDGTYAEDMVQITLVMGVAFSPESSIGPFPSIATAAAVMTIQDVVSNQEARDTMLGAADFIDTFEFTPGRIRPARSRANPRRILLWDGAFTVVLGKRRPLPTS
ncbi:MAG: hypothetical protein E6Q97_06075 [Desulfurellales bacterium]|nr:MAG: hypothetical protein E6Q97_06075 [Desulfurellales bacterium]